MYTLKVIGKFAAAHRLPYYNGKCNQMHGHTWKVIAAYEYEQLYMADHPRQGMAQDFSVLKRQLDSILLEYDHDILNDQDGLDNPTAENIAKAIYDTISSMSNHIVWVEVWESDDAYVRYRPHDHVEIGDALVDVSKNTSRC